MCKSQINKLDSSTSDLVTCDEINSIAGTALCLSECLITSLQRSYQGFIQRVGAWNIPLPPPSTNLVIEFDYCHRY